MSARTPGEDPDVYTMPPGAYRMGENPPASPSPPAASTPPRGGTRPTASPDPESTDARPRRPRKRWDLVLTIVLLVLGAAGAALASVFALFLAFAADSCGAANCAFDQMTFGMYVAFTSPWIAWVLALAGAIVLLVLRRIAFWVPLVGIALGAAGWIVGAVLVGSAIQS